MAKKSFDSEIANEVAEPIVSVDLDADEGEKVQEVEMTTSEKNVKVQIVKPVDCLIGNDTYKFAEGKQVSVPLSVACILCNSGKAYRI